jgi:hypothetical protein
LVGGVLLFMVTFDLTPPLIRLCSKNETNETISLVMIVLLRPSLIWAICAETSWPKIPRRLDPWPLTAESPLQSP